MLINIIISSHSKFAAKEHGNTLHQALTQKLETCTARIMPLKPCPFEQIRNHFRFHIVIKLPPDENEHIKSVIQELPKPDKNTRVIVDFDAWQLL